jgi:ATP-dependent Clp protease ATP-binding subunit ClpC
MFQRFTDRARRVVVLAQHEARTLDHDYIGTEHILLGLIDEGQGVATTALTSMGISLEEMRQAVRDTIGRGAQPPGSGHIPFTPQAKKVLELSLRESMQLGHEYIGTEHILLALTREGGGAAQLLARAGVDLDQARQQVVELLSGYPGAGSAAAPPPAAADELTGRLISIVKRLDAIERRLSQSDAG